MNVLFVSQCSKRALTETRRILDQFAERRGERTWQTPITQAGLDTVRKLLRASARKNTAVACHWIRGRDHSELLWVVGDGRQFNAEGAVPTNTTARNVLRADDENSWHHLPLITALTALAALLHDLGKSTQAFQDRLKNPGLRERNHYRHEWVSVRLLQAFVGQGDDADWLQRLAACADPGSDEQAFEALWLERGKGRLLCDGLDDVAWNTVQKNAANPFATLPPLAQAVAWLVLTHHRLPCKPVPSQDSSSAYDIDDGSEGQRWRRFGRKPSFINRTELHHVLAQVNADWNEPREALPDAQIKAYWAFPHGLPVRNLAWRKQAARYARKLLELVPRYQQAPALQDPFTMHMARMCLMLADHHYSRLGLDKEGQPVAGRKPYLQSKALLTANTTFDGRERRVINQSLDEHLLGVQAHASLITHSLPTLARSLPALQNHKGLKKRSRNPRFQWQDKAADLAASVRHRAADQGAFIVNMASTGCGKTLGNARTMNALADPQLGMRCAFAMGLRTLTLQTGRVFQNDLGLSDEQLAIQVGGAASRALFAYWERQAEASGSASSQGLLDEGGQVLFEGNDRHPLLERLSDDTKVRSLIAAPLLVCTVDHLTPATESLRGGRQIAPMLRLLTGDLVLDEPDDFDMADLPALTRLVHWAGLLGSRVLLSSATLPPALVEGLFLAYRAGRQIFQKHRSERPGEPVNLCCLWIDEFHQTAQDCADAQDFAPAHEAFVKKRMAQLAKADVRRLAHIVSLPQAWSNAGMDKAQRRKEWAQFMLQRARGLHQTSQNHSIDPASGKRVSLGLIRMANIDPLYDVALAMYAHGAPAPGVRVHLCVYHSQFPLLARSVIEQQLDTVLNRRGADDGPDPVFQRPAIRALIDAHPEQDQLFIVLGSPVTEVGRDWSADWAISEPSSMRSLIQLAGRVRRHRSAEVKAVNVEVLDCNLRGLERPSRAAYCKPGFEMDAVPPGSTDAAVHFHLQSHSLQELLSRQLREWGDPQWPIDARPRIARTPGKPSPSRNWVDLEHARMRDAMLPREVGSRTTTLVERAACLAWHEGDSAQPECLWLTGVLPQFQRFREDARPRVDVVLLPDEDGEKLELHRVDDGAQRGEQLYVCIDQSMKVQVSDAVLRPTSQHSVQPWIQLDLLEALRALAQELGLSLEVCAKRYATASLPDEQQGWRWHETLGFTRKA
ncbi:type I-F CRISPR-associated helicase Cas3f [Comamonas composti]|uniref:type I-F CRISPR-associated helicase Cas3f n=1 Tax=Comamonas composti TaxID=408558 RepID=UPI0004172804|nr:type I-F CRISPR-associated helicase Cas3f [Comamonas composti]